QTLYIHFINYLTTLELPPNLTLKEQQQFKKQGTHYIVKNNQLYRKPKGSLQKLLYIIQESELLTILHELHSDIFADHFGIDETYNHAKNKYYWSKMYKTLSSTTNAEEPPYEQQLQ
ncbi:1790_t:CDS:2, partial [Cetraspora pellucida]